MKYKAVIEMAKGEDRRIHLAFDGSGFVDLGPIKDQIAINDGVMPVHYGYIEDTYNAHDDDNVDVIVFSARDYKTGDKTEVEVIGMLSRADGDHKLIATDDSVSIKDFSEVDMAEKDLILKYFGFKSPIVSIDNQTKALEYLESCKVC